jgi:hypothetical protein
MAVVAMVFSLTVSVVDHRCSLPAHSEVVGDEPGIFFTCLARAAPKCGDLAACYGALVFLQLPFEVAFCRLARAVLQGRDLGMQNACYAHIAFSFKYCPCITGLYFLLK